MATAIKQDIAGETARMHEVRSGRLLSGSGSPPGQKGRLPGADRAAPGDLSAPGLDGLIEVLARMLEPLGTGRPGSSGLGLRLGVAVPI